ncbi:GDSL-type esterase/lipase family protein [Streptomyces sp. NPDC004609]|uniref:GDSL-type esterase/lipase family protein n=1 Tax=Streptomyces sp. NPDC004609 TaxID=3364704 RepID=UPI0036B27926
MTWLDPLPFLRGVAWLDDGRPVRADPSDLGRLPRDVVERAALPVGVRLEFTAEGARAAEFRYRASAGAGTPPDCFALWQGDVLVGETFIEPPAEAVVSLPVPAAFTSLTGSPRVFTVHPPESRAHLFLGVRGVGGAVAPAPGRPRRLVHGDSITEGWWSTRPAHSWPARVGRSLALDTVNLGYAGSAHGEPAIAEQLASLPADLLTLAFGTNCWTGVPSTPPLLYETVRAFLALVRQGHPRTPILVVSPVLRPAAEHTRNRLGATLAELRTALERAVRATMADDRWLALLPGRDVLGPGHLADGLHPDDAGHAALAAAVTSALAPWVQGSSRVPRAPGEHGGPPHGRDRPVVNVRAGAPGRLRHRPAGAPRPPPRIAASRTAPVEQT